MALALATIADVEQKLIQAHDCLDYAIASLGRDDAKALYRARCDDLLDKWLELTETGRP